MKTSSWVIYKPGTKDALMETFDVSTMQKLKNKGFGVATILEHLQDINRRIKAGELGK